MILFLGISVWIIFFIVTKKFRYNLPKREEYIIGLVFFLSLSLFFSYKTNLLRCGYHLVDDHEIFRIKHDVQTNGFVNTLFSWIKTDMTIRFRPTYWIIRVIKAALMGNNMLLWHTFQAAEIGICSFVIYVLARKLKCPYFLSGLLALIIPCGEQCPIIWRLGPQEGEGIILLATSYILTIDYHENPNIKKCLKLIIFSCLLAGIKESFLLLVPSEILLLIYLEWAENNNTFSKKSIQNFVLKHAKFIMPNILLTLSCIYVITSFVGTNQIQYAGIDHSYSFVDYYTAVKSIIQNPFSIYMESLVIMILLFVLPLIMVCLAQSKELLIRQLFRLLVSIIFLSYFLGTQFILYSKSGMFERYLIPSVFGVFFFLIVLLYNWYNNCSLLKKYDITYYFLLGILLLNVFKTSNIIPAAQHYAATGIETTDLLETVNAISKDKECNLLVCFGYEEDFASSVYLQIKHDFVNVYNVYYSDNSDDRYHKGYPHANGQDSVSIDEINLFIGNSSLLGDFISEHMPNHAPEAMERIDVGNYSIYRKL